MINSNDGHTEEEIILIILLRPVKEVHIFLYGWFSIRTVSWDSLAYKNFDLFE